MDTEQKKDEKDKPVLKKDKPMRTYVPKAPLW